MHIQLHVYVGSVRIYVHSRTHAAHMHIHIYTWICATHVRIHVHTYVHHCCPTLYRCVRYPNPNMYIHNTYAMKVKVILFWCQSGSEKNAHEIVWEENFPKLIQHGTKLKSKLLLSPQNIETLYKSNVFINHNPLAVSARGISGHVISRAERNVADYE